MDHISTVNFAIDVYTYVAMYMHATLGNYKYMYKSKYVCILIQILT